MADGAAVVRLDWDERQAAIARMALSQLSYATGTGAERADIAEMLADLDGSGEAQMTVTGDRA